MSEAVEGLARAIPSDMEREKAMLVLAMVLTKKIANTMPSLLQRVFSTTVSYISQQLHNYIVRMVSAVRQRGLAPALSCPWSAAFPVALWRSGRKGRPVSPWGAPKADGLREGGWRGTPHGFCLPYSHSSRWTEGL